MGAVIAKTYVDSLGAAQGLRRDAVFTATRKDQHAVLRSRLLECSAKKRVKYLFLYHLNLRVSVGRRSHQDQFPVIFLPNRRASTDHAPGPIIANVAPKVASVSDIQRLAAPVTTIHNSTAATSAPVTGVHNPTRMNKPRTAPVISGIIRPAVGVCSRTIPL